MSIISRIEMQDRKAMKILVNDIDKLIVISKNPPVCGKCVAYKKEITENAKCLDYSDFSASSGSPKMLLDTHITTAQSKCDCNTSSWEKIKEMNKEGRQELFLIRLGFRDLGLRVLALGFTVSI